MKNVAVIFGGVSTEHEVSLRSATSVIQNTDPEKYNVIMIGIAKDGRWYHYTGPVEDLVGGGWQHNGHTTPAVLTPDPSVGGLLVQTEAGWQSLKVDVVFPVLHGKGGEDGTLQGLLDLAEIPYVGCGVAASVNCMDKAYAKMIFTQCGIANAAWLFAAPGDEEGGAFAKLEAEVASKLGYPAFVKPCNQGSSVGVGKAENAQQLQQALAQAFQYDTRVIIEEGIRGHEVECAVMGNEDPIASDVLGEIAPTHGFYDYEGKYLDDSTTLYIPARISEEDTRQVRAEAIKAYKAMSCTGLSRVDFFVKYDAPAGQRVVLNEINTLPGFTSISMFPKLFMASGLSYGQIIDKLIEYALQRAQ
ncbi:MAG: D-alanine--D-alanine ligase [Oscillospiraceae bacterium]|nr:D-alanine--D-alanine ligase [Oscillospiraceae bacterium]